MRKIPDPPINSSEFVLDNLLYNIRKLNDHDKLKEFVEKRDFVQKMLTLMKDSCEG